MEALEGHRDLREVEEHHRVICKVRIKGLLKGVGVERLGSREDRVGPVLVRDQVLLAVLREEERRIRTEDARSKRWIACLIKIVCCKRNQINASSFQHMVVDLVLDTDSHLTRN